jgi:uncharacterized protein (UPF0264 family)
MGDLLVSVRSVAEAEAALVGGAGLIDIKEPGAGSLGRATDVTIRDVLRFVGKRRPVSAALGELVQGEPLFAGKGLNYVKWGLAECGHRPGWQRELSQRAEQLVHSFPECQPVAVAYADWERARAPRPMEVYAFVRDNRWGAFLVDTWSKDGRTLLDWLAYAEIKGLCARCRSDGVRIALAGALGPREISILREVEPDWFAVRTAACSAGLRDRTVEAHRVRHLVELLQTATVAASGGS